MNYGTSICEPVADEMARTLSESCGTNPLSGDAGERVAGKTFLGQSRRWVRSSLNGEPVLLAVVVQLFQVKS